MKEHEAFAGRLRYNEMTATEFFDDKPICEDLIPLAKQLVEEVLGFTPPRESITDAVTQITRANRFHPVQSYLRGLEWDGNQRLIHGAYRYLGVSEPIYADFLYYWMIGAVRRALFPGTKMDTALMLVGKQGAGKSTFFKILGKDWHSDTHIDITHKDSYSVLHESWIYEMSELENLVHGKSEARLKNFLATTHDVFRPAYARCTVRLARSVAICGTTNKPDFLTDSSGSRRFWIIPIDVDKLKLELVEQEVDQLWAEACQLEGIGLNHWFNENKEAQRETHNLQYYQVDPWEDALTQFFASRPLITEVTVCELLSDCLSIEISRQSRYEYVRVGKILAKLGWESRRIRKDSGQTRLYFKPAAGTRQQVHSLE
jgi:predicted P-loop ATPase